MSSDDISDKTTAQHHPVNADGDQITWNQNDAAILGTLDTFFEACELRASAHATSLSSSSTTPRSSEMSSTWTPLKPSPSSWAPQRIQQRWEPTWMFRSSLTADLQDMDPRVAELAERRERAAIARAPDPWRRRTPRIAGVLPSDGLSTTRGQKRGGKMRIQR